MVDVENVEELLLATFYDYCQTILLIGIDMEWNQELSRTEYTVFKDFFKNFLAENYANRNQFERWIWLW